MKYWLKFLVSIALAISIPLQGLAAITMTICEDSPLPVVSMNVDASINTVMDMPADCHHESASNCSDKSSQDCSNMKCSFCHVSVFQLPDTNHVVQMDSYSTTYPDLTIPLYQFFSPPLLHPPKQSLS